VDTKADTAASPLAPSSARDRVNRLRTADGGRVLAIALIVGYLLQVGYRLLLTIPMSFPTVSPDEGTYLVLSRVLAGHSPTELPAAQVIPGGYPLLISPALRLAGNATSAYHLVMVINALLNALVLPLTYVWLRRLGMAARGSYLVATLITLLTPVVFYSEFAMSDTVLPVLMLCWVISLHILFSDGPLRRRCLFGAVAGLSAGYAMATHDRGGVMVAVTAVVLLAALVRRWVPRRAAGSALLTLALGVLFAELLNHYLLSRFETRPSAVADAVLKGLSEPRLMPRTVLRFFGQIWYFSISTWGIGGLGLAMTVARLFRRSTALPNRVLAGVVLATFVGIDLAAAAALPTDHRIDDWIYARYLSTMVPVFFAIGAVGLSHYTRRWLLRASALTAALTATVAVTLVLLLGNRLHKGVFVPWGMPDALFLGGRMGHLSLPLTTLSACAILLCGVGAVARYGRRALVPLAVCGLLLAVVQTAVVTASITHTRMTARHFSGPGFQQAAGIRPGDSVVLDSGLDWYLLKAQPFEVYNGRTWSKKLIKGHVAPPAGATVAVVPRGDRSLPLTASWPDAPAGWYPVKGIRDTDHKTGGYLVVWRHQV
jgi:hypothetical protein